MNKEVVTKSNLVDAIAGSCGCPKSTVAKIVDAFWDEVVKYVSKGKKVQLTGYASFEKKTMPARTGVNPRTGQKMKYPAKEVGKVKVGSKLKNIALSKKSK